MKKLGLLSTSAMSSAALFGMSVAFAAPAFAQDTDQTCTAEQIAAGTCDSEVELESNQVAQDDDDAILVTGSRIRRPNLESVVPITSVGGEEFFETGRISVGDTLNELPALRQTVSQSNSTQFLGTAGLNLLDLRGLGVQRTLVLQNGRRHVPGDILFSGVGVDVNTIPADLIERVDVVTGGNSSVYGSDAIAGVVNFILRRDYDGFQIRGQAGISDEADAGNQFVSAIFGRNFADGRGNIAISAEYAHQQQYFGGHRDFYRFPAGFVTVDSDPAGSPNGSDGNPDRVFFEGVTSPVFSDGGVVLDFFNPDPGGFAGAYFFDPDGTLVKLECDRRGLPPFGSCVNLSANRFSTFRNQGQLQLLPDLQRYNVNVLAHFTISEAFEPFVEAKYSRTESRGTGFSGPAFIQLGGTLGSPRERFFTDNPFLTQQAANVIRGIYGDYYDAVGNCCAGDGVPDADQFGFTILENLIGLGVRDEEATRETYRIVGGVRGDFNDDWNYEVSLNYGEFREDTLVGGNMNIQRFLLAIDAVRDPATGNIVCRATIDPAARIPYESAGDPAEAAARLADDVAQCVPINLFGEGNVTEAARNYVNQDTISVGKITQFVANAFMTGDSSEWFELPGGPIGFVLGAEYRRETNFFEADPLVQAGLTFYNALVTFESPAFEVKELFGELRIPILRDTPFFEELTVSAAGRVADYKGATGTVFAYNAGVEWAPIRDLRFRGNWSRAVRAPNLGELFAELGQNFAPGFIDPCALRNIGAGSATREANCRADGVPANFDFVYAQSLEILSGGNTDLTEETSDSLTIGGVFQPRFIPGLSISVDYYDIKVDDVISSVTAQNLVDACYDASDINNQFCDLIQRNPGPGLGPRGEIPGRILEGTLEVTPLNFAALKVRGIDVEVAYRRQLWDLGRLSARLNWTHVLQADTFLDPTDPARADQFLGELGDPEDQFNLAIDFQSGPYTFGYELRYIGKQLAVSTADWENFFSVQGRPPTNADFSDPIFAPDVFYHDFRLGIDVTERFNFYLGVDNAFDRMPPFRNTGIGDGSAIWSNVGRFFYAGARARF